MSLEMLFDHTCDIYHLQKGTGTPGYGLPESPSFCYSDIPDISEQSCHFSVSSQGDSVTVQKKPMNQMNAKIKLTLPIGTEIYFYDKIVDRGTGLEYTAERPVNVRNHHIFVYIKRTEEQKPL